MDLSELNGAWSPRNCARNIPGPLIVCITFDLCKNNHLITATYELKHEFGPLFSAGVALKEAVQEGHSAHAVVYSGKIVLHTSLSPGLKGPNEAPVKVCERLEVPFGMPTGGAAKCSRLCRKVAT